MKTLRSLVQKQWLIAGILFHALLIALLLVAANGLYSTVKYGVYGHKGAKVYYDAVHCARHLWNRDNRRYRSDYHSISGFFRFFRAMEQEGFKPHAETYGCFNRSILSQYDVYFVGEQTYQGRFMTAEEQAALMEWVADGGGLFVIAEHTNAHYMDEIVNELLKHLPVKARFDAINEASSADPSWLALKDVKEHPITEGVHEYHFYNGCSLDTPHGVLFSSRASWSDKYDPKDAPVNNGNKKKDPDEISGPLAGAAAFTHGKGRVVVVGDHNAFSNLELNFADHHRFILNSLKWLAGDRVNQDFLFGIGAVLLIGLGLGLRRKLFPAVVVSPTSLLAAAAVAGLVLAFGLWSRPVHYHFLMHNGNGPAMELATKALTGYHTAFAHWTKEPQLVPWTHPDLKPGYDALFLCGPTVPYSAGQLAVIRDYLRRRKTVTCLAPLASLDSEAGKQLMQEFDFQVTIDRGFKLDRSVTYSVHGPREWTDSIFRMFVSSDTLPVRVEKLEPVVTLTRDSFHASDRHYRDRTVIFNLISEKPIGGGKFRLMTPMELFDDRMLRGLYLDPDVARQQAAELMTRMLRIAVGDDSVGFQD